MPQLDEFEVGLCIENGDEMITIFLSHP